MLMLNPPNILRNEIYVAGLKEPLLTIADILDEQDQHEYARALRNAAIICEMYVSVVIKKEAVLCSDAICAILTVICAFLIYILI